MELTLQAGVYVFAKDAAARFARERELELLAAGGHCSNKRCSLHYAHSGPCY